MKVVVIGTGYVGLVTGTCLADVGFEVHCVDLDANKIALLRNGKSPIYEPGLEQLLERNIKQNRLHFNTKLSEVLEGTDIVFISVGTPPDEDGSADLTHVLNVAKEIGQLINHYMVIVTKSTVPVGTVNKVKQVIREELEKRKVNVEFDVASNPEFLKEGDAILDFMKPDRIVIGVESERARELLAKLYKPFTLNGHPIIFMDIASAELTKYAANAMLATRISFMNEIANLCERVGANVHMVRIGIGSDSRIGNKFLYPGVGYGGSCFPKDVKALIKTAQEFGYTLKIMEAVEQVNEKQKILMFEKIYTYFNSDLTGKKIALWGLSFKPNTDDMREAPSITLIRRFVSAGANVSAYDPVAMNECRRIIGNLITYADDMYNALDGADCLLLVTEWTHFRAPNWQLVKEKMRHHAIFDGRNIYDSKEIRKMGFYYTGIGVI